MSSVTLYFYAFLITSLKCKLPLRKTLRQSCTMQILDHQLSINVVLNYVSWVSFFYDSQIQVSRIPDQHLWRVCLLVPKHLSRPCAIEAAAGSLMILTAFCSSDSVNNLHDFAWCNHSIETCANMQPAPHDFKASRCCRRLCGLPLCISGMCRNRDHAAQLATMGGLPNLMTLGVKICQ